MTDTLLTDIANGYNKLFDENESLRQQLAAQCKIADMFQALHEKSVKQLAESQAREDYYRSSLEMYISPMPSKDTTVMDVLLAFTESAMEALALPSDSTALDTMLKQARLKGMHEAGG
jgi:hypothetical protein